MAKSAKGMTDAEWNAFMDRTKGGGKTSAYTAPPKKPKPKTEISTSEAARQIRDRKHKLDEAEGYKDGGYVYAKPRAKRKKYTYSKGKKR